jgi:hypothetical protein
MQERKQWADMTAEERKIEKDSGIANALKLVNTGAFPTGIKFELGGKSYIARPQRVTDSGGVTYGLAPQATVAGKHNARFNKFSFTLLGSGSQSAPVEFETEDFTL